MELLLAASQGAAVRTRDLLRRSLPVRVHYPGLDGFHACLSCKGLVVKNHYSGAGLTPLATRIYQILKVNTSVGMGEECRKISSFPRPDLPQVIVGKSFASFGC